MHRARPMSAEVPRVRLAMLLRRRRRVDPGALPLYVANAAVVAAVGIWIGYDLQRGGAKGVPDALYWLLLLLAAPQPMAALATLYHDPLHATLLVWPVSGGQHLALGLRRLFVEQLPWLLLAVGLGGGASAQMDPGVRVWILAFCCSGFCGTLLVSFGAAALCAPAADAPGRTWVQLRSSLAGHFSSQHHAPFFYLPATGFAASAVSLVAAEAGVLRALVGQPDATAVGLVVAPPAAGVLLALWGGAGYRSTALRVIPRVVEEARSVYGGEPAPVDPPYGASIARLVPRALAPFYDKELRELVRGRRGLWAWIALVCVASLAYGVNAGRPLRAAPLIGVALGVWFGALPARRTPQQHGARMLLTLPVRRWSSLLGRLGAGWFVCAHLAVAIAGALWARHSLRAAATVLLATLTAVLVAVATTRPASRAAGPATRWSVGAQLAGPAVLAAGLAAMLWPRAGAIALGAVAVAALVAGRFLR